METIQIFKDVNVNLDKISTHSYESLFRLAMMTKEFKGKKGAKSVINKTLREHGFKPTKATGKQTKTDKPKQSRVVNESGNTSKRKRNSSVSKK